MKNYKRKVLILTGPGGAGKTTIADLLVNRCGFVKVDGDHLDSEFFPQGGHWLPENLPKLRNAQDKIFNEVKKSFNNGLNNVVLDYIIFGEYINFIERFKKEFGKNFQIKVLFPSKQEMIKRDRNRECWTTGVDRITAVREEFNALKDFIGLENFIDSTGEIEDETFKKYFKELYA